MPTEYSEQASRAASLIWILIAYILCFAAASYYLVYLNYFGDLLIDSFAADTIATVVIFAFSRLFKNSSFYDAYWSVFPPFLLVFWWTHKHMDADTTRFIMISIVVWLWAIRLTWNWTKHWTGLHHEDWRYGMLKDGMPKLEMFTDFFGIHYFPTIQVFLGMIPVYACLVLSDAPLNWLDYVAFVLGVAASIIQLVSDRQLHDFIAVRKPGQIIEHGLWAYSRHPNYFGELLLWFSLGVFGLAAYPEGWWWQMIGFVAMLLMFMLASIPMMEKRSLERRPEYQATIDKISMVFPWPQKKPKA